MKKLAIILVCLAFALSFSSPAISKGKAISHPIMFKGVP